MGRISLGFVWFMAIWLVLAFFTGIVLGLLRVHTEPDGMGNILGQMAFLALLIVIAARNRLPGMRPQLPGAPPPATPEEKTSARIWIPLLVLICLGILLFGWFISRNDNDDAAYLAGRYLVFTLLWWGVFQAKFMRGLGGLPKTAAFIAIYASFMTASLVAADRNISKKENTDLAISSILSEVDRVAGAVDENGLPTKIEPRKDRTPQASGEAGEMERFIKAVFDDSIKQRNDYFTELEAVKWETLLTAENLKNDPDLSKSRKIIADTKLLIDKYERMSFELMDRARARVSQMAISERSKREFAAGVELGMIKNKSRLQKLWGMERSAILEAEKAIEVLASRKKGWAIQDGGLVFDSDQQLENYNRHIVEMQNIVQRQQELMQQGMQQARENLQAISPPPQ